MTRSDNVETSVSGLIRGRWLVAVVVTFTAAAAAFKVFSAGTAATTAATTTIALDPDFKQQKRAEMAVDLDTVDENPAVVSRLREQLLREIWRDTVPLPEDLPTTVSQTDPSETGRDWPFPEIRSFSPAWEFRIVDDSASAAAPFVNYSYLFRFENHPNRQNRLLIIHQGHGGIAANLTDTVALEAVARGFDVLYMNMPLTGDNTGPDLSAAESHATLCCHRFLGSLERKDFNPLSLMFNQIPTALRTAEEINKQAYSEINMCGISGGGYTTTVYAAVDARIQHSFCISGSMPHLLRDSKEVGWEDDFSQSVFQICPIHLMYVLASVGRSGRTHYQCYNAGDSVFPASDMRFSVYSPVVRDVVERLGGTFDVLVDWHSQQHHITDIMQTEIFDVLGSVD